MLESGGGIIFRVNYNSSRMSFQISFEWTESCGIFFWLTKWNELGKKINIVNGTEHGWFRMEWDGFKWGETHFKLFPPGCKGYKTP